MHTSGITCLASQALPMEPLLFTDEWIYVPGRSGVGEAFVLLGGHRLEMRPLSMRVYREERERTLWPTLLERMKAALPERPPDPGRDPVLYFLSLAAAVNEIEARVDGGPVGRQNQKGATAGGVLEQAAAAASQFPLPRLPAPSLLLLNQAWPLDRQQYARSRLQIRMGNQLYGISKRPISLASLDEAYQREVTAFVERETSRSGWAQAEGTPTLSGLEEARAMRKSGFIQSGDLILIASQPPLIGCLLPSHHNHSFGRQCKGDMAVTFPLTAPLNLDLAKIRVAERFSTGRWREAQLPCGLCWGQTPSLSHELEGKPGLALIALLRCLSTRFAQNGQFHASG